MIAGTLGLLDAPTDTPLDSTYGGGGDGLPALSVDRTQESFDGGPIQSGTAAARVRTEQRDVSVAHDLDGEPAGIMVDRTESTEPVVSEWVADPTGSGLVAGASLAGDPTDPFPFDLIGEVAGRRVVRQHVDVQQLHMDWMNRDALGDVWMVGSEYGDGASIDYHDAAEADVRPTIGMGFNRPWANGHVRGVVYQSGYVACYSLENAATFARFVSEELLAYCDGAPEEEDAPGEQATLEV